MADCAIRAVPCDGTSLAQKASFYHPCDGHTIALLAVEQQHRNGGDAKSNCNSRILLDIQSNARNLKSTYIHKYQLVVGAAVSCQNSSSRRIIVVDELR